MTEQPTSPAKRNCDGQPSLAPATCYASGLKHLDLFSGIGGFAIAAADAGFETIGFSEIEPYASKLLKQYWPDVPNYGDVRTVPTVECDLITGGFPCQPFSLAGKRRGASDDRFLWPAMLDVIARCKPTWVCGENVPGIVGMELDRVLTDLEGIGFRTQPLAVPACAVGMDQIRERIWIIAHNPNAVCLRQQRERTTTKEPWAREQFEGLVSADLRMCVSAGRRGGVSYGLPNRSHRLKGLGNAIVPQVATVILKAMARTHNNALSQSHENGPQF